MSDQFRQRWDREHRQQKTRKPDYLEEIRLDNQLRREVRYGRLELDSEFRVKHPSEFLVARRNREQIFSFVDDPPIFLRESLNEQAFILFPSDSLQDFTETYELDAEEKFSKQLFRRLKSYADAIQKLLKDEFRQWPMRIFVNPPLPRQFNFSNKQGMVATVTILNLKV
jgi:hypothetical protein